MSNISIYQSEIFKEFDSFLEEQGSSKKTRKNYLSDLKNFESFMNESFGIHLSKESLSRLSPVVISSYKEHLEQSYKPASVIRYMTSLKSFLQCFNLDRYINKKFEDGYSNNSAFKQTVDNWKFHLQEKGHHPFAIKQDVAHIEDFLHWIKHSKNQ